MLCLVVALLSVQRWNLLLAHTTGSPPRETSAGLGQLPAAAYMLASVKILKGSNSSACKPDAVVRDFFKSSKLIVVRKSTQYLTGHLLVVGQR